MRELKPCGEEGEAYCGKDEGETDDVGDEKDVVGFLSPKRRREKEDEVDANEGNQAPYAGWTKDILLKSTRKRPHVNWRVINLCFHEGCKRLTIMDAVDVCSQHY